MLDKEYFNSKYCRKPHYKSNPILVDGEIIIISVFNNKKKILIDREDYPKIRNICWHISKGYARGTIQGKTIAMHRLIMDAPSNVFIDHINGDKSDNRKSNLRVCSNKENSRNSSLSKNNTSGMTGVSWDKSRNKWCAEIKVDYKKKHLGRYVSLEEAIKVRKEAEIKYFGEFAPHICRNKTNEE